MIQRSAFAVWNGGLKDGHGVLTTASGVLQKTQYGFNSRFESGAGTNPEELVAAAHAGCFAMAFSMILGNAGFTAEEIEAKGTVKLEQKDGGFAVTQSRLEVKARIPGIDETKFQELANVAKQNCPISKLLNTEITMDAQLHS